MSSIYFEAISLDPRVDLNRFVRRPDADSGQDWSIALLALFWLPSVMACFLNANSILRLRSLI